MDFETTNLINQEMALEKLSKLKSGALFMECGTGKTKVALDLIKLKKDVIDVVIWIAPASLVHSRNYKDEVEKWSRGLDKPIHFYTIEVIAYNDARFMEMYNLALYNRSFCIVDESITIKNAAAKRTQRLVKNYNVFDYRLILNGVPITKGLTDLYSQIKFISPRILDMTETQFVNKFFSNMSNEYLSWKKWSTPEKEKLLVDIIRPYIFDSQLEIQVKSEFHDIGVDLTKEEKTKYVENKEKFLNRKNILRFLCISQKFQSFYTDCINKKKKAAEIIREIIARDEKVIIYVKFLSEVKFFQKNFDCVIFTSKQKGDLNEFRDKKPVLICTYGVGSMGLNLQFCNNIIYYSQTFDYGLKEQSFYRVYRIGQKKNVNIYNLWVNGINLEKMIQNSLQMKNKTLKNIKKEISKENAAAL